MRYLALVYYTQKSMKILVLHMLKMSALSVVKLLSTSETFIAINTLLLAVTERISPASSEVSELYIVIPMVLLTVRETNTAVLEIGMNSTLAGY